MSTPQHEDRAMHRFMSAPLADQAAQLREWGEEPAGLLILMSACEGQCFFCAQPVVTDPPPSMITRWAAVDKKLQDNLRLGLRSLMVGGTEPPTHPAFERTLQVAQQSGFESVQLMTSGLQLASKGAQWRDLGVQSVCTPLYSAEASVHDGIVGVPGHWAQVVAGLDAASGLGMTVYVHTLAMRRTLSTVPDLAQWVRDRWGRALALAPMRPKADLFPYEEEAPLLDAVRDACSPNVSLVGFPRCVDVPGEAALLTRLYFRSQARAYAEPCHGCTVRQQCGGVVVGHLETFGASGLQPV